jgi:hypothetical protein
MIVFQHKMLLISVFSFILSILKIWQKLTQYVNLGNDFHMFKASTIHIFQAKFHVGNHF